MTVTALLYSGRPNPEWLVDPSVARNISQQIGSLPELLGASKPEAGLGYSGVVVTQGQRHWQIGGGLIAEGKRLFADPERCVERAVLETARGYIDGPTLDGLLRAI